MDINYNKANVLRLLLVFLFIVSFASLFCNVYGYEISIIREGIESFPNSYKEKLYELKKEHPNWNFAAVYTNLDFDYVVNEEMVDGRSLIQKSEYDAKWRKDDKEIEAGWVNASKYAITYFLDPRNFLDESTIFQFMSLEFNEPVSVVGAVEQILNNTGMHKSNYYINNSKVIKMGENYSDIIYNSAKKYNLNPVYLASRIIQETGGTIASLDKNGNVIKDSSGNLKYFNGKEYINANKSLNGSYINATLGSFVGYYNFFNIGSKCTDKCKYCGSPFIHGLEKAKESGWTSPKIAIGAAAEFIRKNYVNYGQNTIYFQKFDVNFVQGSKYLFSGQYMSNISAAMTESNIIYNGYKNASMIEGQFTFYIPVYNSMPDTYEKELPFTDVKTDSWYYNAVRYAYNNKIINGTSKVTFSPDNKLTRGMLVTILYGMEGAPKVTGKCIFSDVSSKMYYYNAVTWASERGIVNGYNGKFNPDSYITRQDLAVVLSAYCKYKGKYVQSSSSILDFKDYKEVASYALSAVKWATHNNIINGANGKIIPKGESTRKEAITMIYSYCLKFR